MPRNSELSQAVAGSKSDGVKPDAFLHKHVLSSSDAQTLSRSAQKMVEQTSNGSEKLHATRL